MKPSSTNDNYIPQTITLGCIVLFSLAVRSTTLSCGADGFTAFCVFLICSVVFFLLFLAVQSLLEELFGHIFRSQEREVIEPPKTIFPTPSPSNYEQFRQEAFQVKASRHLLHPKDTCSLYERGRADKTLRTDYPLSVL